MSSSSSKYLSIARMVIFVTTILFSVFVISLSADLLVLTSDIPGSFQFLPLALSTALLSKLTVIKMLVIDYFRHGSFFSYIVVEIVSLSLLSFLWLSTGSYAAWTDNQIIALAPDESTCDFGLFGVNPGVTQFCHEIKAIMAFSFLTWILLMSYTVVLVVLAIRAQQRGNSAWTTGVRDGVLFYSVRKTMEGPALVQAAPATIPYTLPLQQQPPSQQRYPPYPSSYPIAQV